MKIRWLMDCELNLVTNYDEENDTTEENAEIVKTGEYDEVDVVGDRGNDVDMQFGNGSVALGISKQWFEVVEE